MLRQCRLLCVLESLRLVVFGVVWVGSAGSRGLCVAVWLVWGHTWWGPFALSAGRRLVVGGGLAARLWFPVGSTVLGGCRWGPVFGQYCLSPVVVFVVLVAAAAVAVASSQAYSPVGGSCCPWSL